MDPPWTYTSMARWYMCWYAYEPKFTNKWQKGRAPETLQIDCDNEGFPPITPPKTLDNLKEL